MSVSDKSGFEVKLDSFQVACGLLPADPYSRESLPIYGQLSTIGILRAEVRFCIGDQKAHLDQRKSKLVSNYETGPAGENSLTFSHSDMNNFEQ